MPHDIEPIDLAKYRLEQARECLRDAENAVGTSNKNAANRSYYTSSTQCGLYWHLKDLIQKSTVGLFLRSDSDTLKPVFLSHFFQISLEVHLLSEIAVIMRIFLWHQNPKWKSR